MTNRWGGGGDGGWDAVWQRKGRDAIASGALDLPALLRADGFDTATGVVDVDVWLRRGAALASKLRLCDPSNRIRALRVLEAGCGAGAMLWALRAAIADVADVADVAAPDAGVSFVGVEPAESLRALCARALPDIDVHAGTAQAVPVDDASCDAVFVHSVVAYFDDLADVDAAVAELVRVARPGAPVALLDVPDAALREACEAERARLVGSTADGRGGLHHLYVPRARIASAADAVGRVAEFVDGDPALHAMARFRYDAWLWPR